MQSIAILFLCVGSAILYGIVHDQVTARICVEYFTIGHPPIMDTEDPTLLALGWGVLATWWVGVGLGVPLAVAARAGSRPKRDVANLVRPVLTLLAVMALGAIVAGLLGWILAENGVVRLIGPMAEQVPIEKQVSFLINLWAHSASYLVGIVGGLVVIVRVWRSRKIPSGGK